MKTITKQRRYLAIGIPTLIFLACSLIAFSSVFKTHIDRLSIGILMDLLIVAPLAYFLLIRKTSISKVTVLRVFMLGVFVASLLLAKGNSMLLEIVKTWISPVIEVSLIGFIVWKFYAANKMLKATNQPKIDFLFHCRSILKTVFGNEKAANVIASEVSVFYYIISRRDKTIDHQTRFSTYKQTGIVMVLNVFLCMFISETIGMHFVFRLWNETAAWILTLLSAYTCLQLLAHIRALKSRSVVITENQLILRNGLMGGDVILDRSAIALVELTNKTNSPAETIQLAFIKGLEKPNVAIHLKDAVMVTKVFGIRKSAKVILLNIDQQEKFMNALKEN